MADREAVKSRLALLLRVPVERIEDTALLTDVVAESLLLVELVIELQEQLGVRLVQEDLQHVRTVADLTQLFEARSRPAQP
jgi:acyl carrier protein